MATLRYTHIAIATSYMPKRHAKSLARLRALLAGFRMMSRAYSVAVQLFASAILKELKKPPTMSGFLFN